MTVLAYATTAEESSLEGAEFGALLEQLETEYPGTLVLPASAHPPRQTLPSANSDWVTLPHPSRRGTRLSLLRTYARWYQPVVSLFHGTDAGDIATSCQDTLFGLRLYPYQGQWQALTGRGTTPASLEAWLVPRLPLCIVVGGEQTPQDLGELLQKRRAAPEVRIYCPDTLDSSVRATVEQVAKSHEGRIHLHVRLQHGILQNKSAIGQWLALHRSPSRFQLTVTAELAMGSLGATVLSQTWNALRKPGRHSS